MVEKSNLRKDITTDTPENVPGCQIKKGRCVKHNLEARKIINNFKKWGKKGTGYGWLNRRITKYVCKLENLVPDVPDISTSSVTDNLSEYTRGSGD